MSTSDKLKLNIVMPPRLRSDLQKIADAREQTVSEVARQAIRKEVRRELPVITRGAVPRKEGP